MSEVGVCPCTGRVDGVLQFAPASIGIVDGAAAFYFGKEDLQVTYQGVMHFQTGFILIVHAFQQFGHQMEYGHYQWVGQCPLVSGCLHTCHVVRLQHAETVTGTIADRFSIYHDFVSLYGHGIGIG